MLQVYNVCVHAICYISKVYYILLVFLNIFYANSWSVLSATVNFYSNRR